jgi:hypothetical protein
MAGRRAAAEKARHFYSQALSEAERADFGVALEMEGIEAEVALLRVRLRQVLIDHADDLPLMLRGIDLLSKALGRRYHLGTQEAQAAADAIRDVLSEFRSEAEVKELTGG